jgi:hypothetical protein
VPVIAPRAIVFVGDTLLAASSNGIYQINSSTYSCVQRWAFAGTPINAMTVDPSTGRIFLIANDGLWNDYFGHVNARYGDIGVIGRVGASGGIASLAIDQHMQIVGLESPATGASRLFAIDTATGMGTLVQMLGNSGLRGITFDQRIPVTSVLPLEPRMLPEQFALEQNYPNPFNPATVISYQLSAVSKVDLRVYDLLGREVAVLMNEEKPAGRYSVTVACGGGCVHEENDFAPLMLEDIRIEIKNKHRYSWMNCK